MAGIMAMGWRTFAPKYASSAASSNDTFDTGTAAGTIRGSQDIMPSTSFQTCTSSRPHAAPMVVAVRSEPPRPRVVILPLTSWPMKPVTTVTVPGSIFSLKQLRIFASEPGSTVASPKLLVVSIPTVQLSYAAAGTPSWLRRAATMRDDMRSPNDTSMSRDRGDSSWRSLTPESMFSSSSSSPSTSSLTCSPMPNCSMVARCKVLSGSTEILPCSAKSPAFRRLFVVLPMAEQTTAEGKEPMDI
mmetsp:Transcript_22077/g.46104  ORF Transcript_22077/g.46104 Transcript_22077/m.46104 type:complete len:244 (+) Transcript_22077:670-1401(+)